MSKVYSHVAGDGSRLRFSSDDGSGRVLDIPAPAADAPPRQILDFSVLAGLTGVPEALAARVAEAYMDEHEVAPMHVVHGGLAG